MKLSTAIRKGAELRPQTIIRPFESRFIKGKRQICSCALGAAYEATFPSANVEDLLSADEEIAIDLRLKYPILDRKAEHPEEEHSLIDYDVQDIVVDLNDEYDWTREQIADWVETIEETEQ